MKVLVIAAHPDDEVLGCGGTAARLAQEGQEVHCAILGEGMTSRYAQSNDADTSLLTALHQQARAAAVRLRIENLTQHQLPDSRLDAMPLLEIVKLVEAVVDEVKLEVIYTHHGGDLNVDHGIIHRAALTATRPVSGQPVREVYAFEVPSSTEWAFQQIGPSFRPNVFVDITHTLEIKISAMNCYETEARKFPHPRSPEALRALATRWGSVCGCDAAEAFELIRSVRPRNL